MTKTRYCCWPSLCAPDASPRLQLARKCPQNAAISPPATSKRSSMKTSIGSASAFSALAHSLGNGIARAQHANRQMASAPTTGNKLGRLAPDAQVRARWVGHGGSWLRRALIKAANSSNRSERVGAARAQPQDDTAR